MRPSAFLLTIVAVPASAHPGAHVHPHDGSSWLLIVAALGAIAVAARLAVSTARARK